MNHRSASPTLSASRLPPALAVTVLCALFSACAANPPVPSAPHRPLADLIQEATSKGEDHVVSMGVSQDIGFTAPVNTKHLFKDFRTSSTTEGTHAFDVVYDDTRQPATLIWQYILVTTISTEYYDAWTIRTDIQGQILAAAHGKGRHNSVIQNPVPINNTVRRILKAEMDEFLRIQ